MKRYVRPLKEVARGISDEPVSLFFGEEPAYFSDIKLKRTKGKSKKLLKKLKKQRRREVKQQKREERLLVFARMSYADYLQTGYWKWLRDKVKKRDNKKCQVCGEIEGIQVHHKIYCRRGTEHKKMDNLITLCGCCHMDTHGIDSGLYQPWGGRVGHGTNGPTCL